MEAGLFPNQTRRGLRMFGEFLPLLERFTDALGMELIVAEPLSYDNAIRYEKYGFDYVVGKRMMQEIDAGFAPGGALCRRLDGSTPFAGPAWRRASSGGAGRSTTASWTTPGTGSPSTRRSASTRASTPSPTREALRRCAIARETTPIPGIVYYTPAEGARVTGLDGKVR